MGRTSDAKDRLLQAALDLIWTNSYGAVSVDQICECAGVKKGSFYYFFPSKSDLAVEAYEAHWQQKRPEMDRIFSPQVPPLQRIENLCQCLYEGQKSKATQYGRVCGCPYASVGAEVATQDEKIRAKSEELMHRSLRYLESAIADAARDGFISVDDPASVAKQVYSLTLGLMIRAKVQNDPEVLAELAPSVFRMLGVRQPVPSSGELPVTVPVPA
ncbi:MAG TPA: TetR/AcrR family transcriptional regulator [Candidatus Limnocylindria bacterium]|jgi:TetR/AcrR family transcriptional repressor of nem operon|nr:TetR/AcrR family transcriptional regulator [Candidatus Limnocylindria bacterium]